MTTSKHGYPLARSAREMDRLRLQAQALEDDAEALLRRIGVEPGWRCLDLGCGVGGITNLLSRLAGPSGTVTGLDVDAEKLAAARQWAAAEGLANIEFVQGDVFDLALPAAHFDLTHVRFLFTTIGRADELLAAALAVTRPGGVLAVQEADVVTLSCQPPNPACDRLIEVLIEVFERIGGDPWAGPKMFNLLRGAGLENVRYRPFVVGATHADRFADYLPETIRSLRGAMVSHGLIGESELDEALAECEVHLGDPGTITTPYLVCQVWGRVAG